MIDWLADTLLATSLLMALLLLVREPVRRQFGPAVAYGLWLIPPLRLIMPPLTRTVERSVPAAEPVTAPLALGPPQPAQPLAMPAAETSRIEHLGGWESLAVSAWLTGASAMLLFGLLIYRRQRREVLRDSVQFARLGNIRMVRSPAVSGPLAFGILDRVVAVPIDFDERYDPHERRLALDHELAHHRCGDLVANQLAFLLLCLQWFNPLAWASHSAFRFDQEAACDARILARVASQDRAAYAHAIVKSASGPGLLFAGALDRPGTLCRRLRSMLIRPSTGRRVAGKALIAMIAAAGLPLTASRATHYVDVAPPAAAIASRVAAAANDPIPPPPGAEPASAVEAATPTEAADAEHPVPVIGGITFAPDTIAFFEDDSVLINGKRKRLEQLTGAERSKLRAAILESQREQVRERAELPGQLAELRREAERARSGELRRQLMRDREDLRRDLAEVDSRADELRAEGDDPEKRKAEILRDLREAEAIDIDKEIREAIESADPDRIVAELRSEEQQMSRLLARLDQLDRR